MSLERIFKALLSLGLSHNDARVYIFLALKGPEETISIVKNLKTTKQQIYRSLKHLQDIGIIVSDAERKNDFSALSFEKALEVIITKEREQTKKTQKTLLKSWKSIIMKNSKN